MTLLFGLLRPKQRLLLTSAMTTIRSWYLAFVPVALIKQRGSKARSLPSNHGGLRHQDYWTWAWRSGCSVVCLISNDLLYSKVQEDLNGIILFHVCFATIIFSFHWCWLHRSMVISKTAIPCVDCVWDWMGVPESVVACIPYLIHAWLGSD